MVIVKLNGGLGNQMFQYACGRNIALREKTDLFLDIKFYTRDQKKIGVTRNYSLGNFNIIEKIATESELQKIDFKLSLTRRIFRKLRLVLLPNLQYEVYDVIYKSSNKNDLYLDGFWQDEMYFKDIRDKLLDEFSLKNGFGTESSKIEEIISRAKDSVSLHIRRGDYVNNKTTNSILGVQPLEYYQEAVETMKNKLEHPEFFVFSDDIKWAEENLKFNFPFHFVSNEKIKDYEEIMLMSKCAHNIIANSSFSWWGAWLNRNAQKIVVAPRRWYVNPSPNMKNPVPNSWIKI